MKPLLLLSTLAALALAAPGGYYYQESSSRSSSSSYKNNELQHQTEDESYYSRQGDPEGRTQPKVNTYSQHLKYQNPHNQNSGHSTNLGSQSQSTLGHSDVSDVQAARQAVGSDGIVRSVSGNRDHYTYTATYGVSGGESTPLRGGQYDTQSSLLSLTQTLQNDLARKLNTAITQQRTTDSHSGNTYVETNFRNLEQELKANLSRQLQEELQRHYGSQMNRGSYSYTVQNGHYSPQANYNTQELQDLTSQLESNLMQQLRNQYQNTQSSSSSNSNYYSSSSSSQQTEQGSRAHTSMYRPTYESFPVHPEVRPSVPLTDVLSQVQSTVDRRLNSALSRVEQQYITQNTYREVPNYDIILENLKEELKRNISSILQTTLVEYYGTQEEHHNYYYSSRNVASGSKVANYNTDDLNSLKQQVENNLVQKLTTSIQQQKQNYQTTSQSNSHSQSYNSNYNRGYPTPINGKSSSPDIYTSYVVFTPSRKPDSVYSQTSTHNSENTYGSVNEQTNTRPEYRPSYTPTDTQRPSYTQTDTQRPSYTSTDTQRPIRYGTYQPSSSQSTNYGTNTYRTNSQNQGAQRVEQLEYDYSPTGNHNPAGTGPTQVSQTPTRGTYYPSNSGSSIPSGGVHYPSHTQDIYPTSNTRYPSSSYPSGGDGYQTNYQTSQQSSESSHKIVSGQRETGIEYTPGLNRSQQPEYQAELINIRDQVQNDLSRQVNTAIENQRQSSRSYSSSSVSSSQVLSDLSEELKRNLTQKVEKVLNEHYGKTGTRGGYTFTLSSGGRINPGNYNREQLTALTNQLQEDLLRQLREGLAQQSYRQTSAYGSSYEPVISQGTYGHSGSNAYRSYSSGSSYSYSSNGGHGQGECCMQADDSTTIAEEDMNQVPERGDIHIDSNNQKKLKDTNSESDITQQKTDDIQTQNHSVDIEVIPPEATEVTIPKLARDKPSTKKPLTVESTRQETPKPRLTSQTARDTQDLINFERHQNENDNQQTVHEQRNQNPHYSDQQIVRQSHFDQDQQNRRILQSTITDLSTNTQQRNKQTLQNQNEQKLSQQTEDLTQQTEDLHQQTQDLNQQTEDLDQQTQDLSQQFEDLNQQTLDLNQHTENLNQQTEDLSQQTEDLSQQTQNLGQQFEDLNQQTENLGQQTEDLSQQTEDLSQQTQNLGQQFEDLNQQTENLGQQTENLSQQTVDSSQQTVDLSQQTEYLNQHTQNLNQQSEDLSQQVGNLNQQTENLDQHAHIENSDQITENLHQQQIEDLNQHFEEQNLGRQRSRFSNERGNVPHVYLEQQPSAETHNHASEHRQHTSQQSQDTSQNGEIQQNHNRGPYGSRFSQSSFQSYNTQSSSSHSSSASGQVHYGTVNHIPLQTTNNLEQQHLDLQNANIVQDVSHQVIVPSSSTHDINTDVQKLEDPAEITTEKPGFWKKLGSKITKTYHKAKDSISSIG